MPDANTSSVSSSCGPNIAITLLPKFQQTYVAGTTVGYRLRITAANACGLDDSVFRYYMFTANTVTGVADAVFSGVCSWPDMTELPENEPEDDTSPAGFRLNYIDIVVESETVAQEVWALVQEEVAELVQTIQDGETLVAQAPVVITAT